MAYDAHYYIHCCIRNYLDDTDVDILWHDDGKEENKQNNDDDNDIYDEDLLFYIDDVMMTNKQVQKLYYFDS